MTPITAAPALHMPEHVLFLCTRNAVRSPMAEALGERHCRRRVLFQSAGIEAGELDPFAVQVMMELGLDISRHQPKSLEDLQLEAFSGLIISLSPEAHHSAIELTRNPKISAEYWATADPTFTEGNRMQKLDAYKAVRDGLLARIERRFPILSPGHL